jgi:ATP-dependent Lon protease
MSNTLSIFLQRVRNGVKKTQDFRLILDRSRRIIVNAQFNLNRNYHTGLIQRFYYSTHMGNIEKILGDIGRLYNKPLLKDYEENVSELIDIIKERERIVFSVGLKSFNQLLGYIQSVYINDNQDIFIKHKEELSFLDEYLDIVSVSLEDRNIISPLFIDIHAIGQTTYDSLFTLFILIPLQSQKALQIKVHLRRDNMNFLKKHPYFREKMSKLETPYALASQDKQTIFINDFLTNKDFLIKNVSQIRKMFFDSLRNFKEYKDLQYTKLFKIFGSKRLIEKRDIMSTILLFSTKEENYIHIAWLLYDFYQNTDSELTKSTPGVPDLWDILPWKAQKLLKMAKNKVYESKNMVENRNVDDDLTYEQRIELMKVSKKVKNKAYRKLKEMSGKHSDSATKATNWLEGLLKIPFGTYKKEQFIKQFQELREHVEVTVNRNITNGEENTTQEGLIPHKKIYYYDLKLIFNGLKKMAELCDDDNLNHELKKRNVRELRVLLKTIIPGRSLKKNELRKKNMVSILRDHILQHEDKLQMIRNHIIPSQNRQLGETAKASQIDYIKLLENENIEQLQNRWTLLQQLQNKFMTNMKSTLDRSIYAHNNAKLQIERIVSQWMTGKSNGYVLGFEGPPGVGKTTLAKHGLAKALKDEDGNPRPFHFIAIGGSCNGSTLEGHSYTYMGSQWGSIVNVLMDSKCMNPIIFFDELDKVSNTSHGREIIGILTHLTDSTQNTSFQDKYFAGIDLDLSKALIIFSYNDPANIDPILLDRIHRIKFKELNLTDKMVVIHDYLIPSMCDEIGLSRDMVYWEEDLMKFVIENYTAEPGVRKIKQILYDIYREINLMMLNDAIMEYPFMVTKDFLTENILKRYIRIYPMTIKNKAHVGMINGMYATRSGYGGILPIECKWICDSNPFKLHLTGSLKEVMQESMSIAKNLALELLPDAKRSQLVRKLTKKDNIMKGIHIHCPEGAVPKDGPSAGMAITLCLYSLFTRKKIPDRYSFTGEIRLSGEVLRVGGISSKVQGALRAGVTHILLPEENRKDYEMFMEEEENVKEHTIHFVNNIHEAMDILWN